MKYSKEEEKLILTEKEEQLLEESKLSVGYCGYKLYFNVEGE